MDHEQYRQLIDDLRGWLRRIEETISILEHMPYADRRSKRGRKGMGAAERLEVSERMRNYWAKRRQRSGPVTPGDDLSCAEPPDSRTAKRR